MRIVTAYNMCRRLQPTICADDGSLQYVQTIAAYNMCRQWQPTICADNCSYAQAMTAKDMRKQRPLNNMRRMTAYSKD